MEDKKEKLPSTRIQCLSCIYGDYHLTPYNMGVFKN